MPIIFYLILLFFEPPVFQGVDVVVADSKEGFVFITNDSLYFTVDGNTFTKRSHKFGLDMYRMRAVPKIDNSSKTFFLSEGGGLVYQYDEEKDTLQRLDNSYRFMSRFGEAAVSFKDTIFSYGGYGEFSYNNKLIKFKADFKEWNVIHIEGQPMPMRHNLIQYDTLTKEIYVGLGNSMYFENGNEKRQNHFDIIRFQPNGTYETIGSFKGIEEEFADYSIEGKSLRNFGGYRMPMLYSTNGLWTVDLRELKAYHHIKADRNRLLQYTDIIAYNPDTNRFLMVSNYRHKDPRSHVVHALDLLGLEYEEYSLAEVKISVWGYSIFALLLLFLLPLFRTKTSVLLNEAIRSNERRVQQRLSSEDFFILKRIVDAYPECVEYPELQNSYEKDLSYESRIKKLRASIKEIDEVVQEVIGRKRNSIFEIEKGREDKRVKVIRIKNNQLKKVDLFGRLRRGSK